MSFENAEYTPRKKRDTGADLLASINLFLRERGNNVMLAYLFFAAVALEGVWLALFIFADELRPLYTITGVPGLYVIVVVASQSLYGWMTGATYIGTTWRYTLALLLLVPPALSLLHPHWGGTLGDGLAGTLVALLRQFTTLDWAYLTAMLVVACLIAATAIMAQIPLVSLFINMGYVTKTAFHSQADRDFVTKPKAGRDTVTRPNNQGKQTALTTALELHGIPGAVEHSVLKGLVLVRHKIRLPVGAKIGKVDLGDFARDIGASVVTVEKNAGDGCIGIDIPRPDRQFVPLNAMLSNPAWVKRDRSMRLPVMPFVDFLGSPVVFDLAAGAQWICAGTTGGGKSVVGQAVMLSLIASGVPFRTLVADGKGEDFAPHFRGSRHLVDAVHGADENGEGGVPVPGVATTIDEFILQLQWLEAEMERRQGGGEKPYPIVYICDELANLQDKGETVKGNYGGRNPIKDALNHLAEKARSAHITMFLMTQRPDAETLDGRLRGNVPSRMALMTGTKKESGIILDDIGAENLLGKGDVLLKSNGIWGNKLIRAHGLSVTDTDLHGIRDS